MKIKPTPDRGRSHVHSDEYDTYLQSETWRATRAAALARAAFLCQGPGCVEQAGLEVHHRHYQSLGSEAWGDLQVLCPACHQAADRRRAQTIALTRRLRAVRDAERGGR